MYGFFGMVVWVLLVILAFTWLFLPWIIISKMDQVIDELHSISQMLARSRA